MAAGGVTGPGFPLASRIVKDRSTRQGSARAILPACFTAGSTGTVMRYVSMKNAVEAARQEEADRHAAELYNVPMSTLSDNVLCKVPLSPTFLFKYRRRGRAYQFSLRNG